VLRRLLAPVAVRRVCLAVLGAAIIGASVHGLRDTHQRWRIEWQRAFQQKQWPTILALAKSLPPSAINAFLRHDINRALYHTGQLGEEMFTYPQDPFGVTLVIFRHQYLPDTFHSNLYERMADTFCQLGRLNEAEHWGHELMQLQGDHPNTLALLAKVNLAKEQPVAARTFLRYMADRGNSLSGGQWARQHLAVAPGSAALPCAEEICRLGQCRLKDDTYVWQLEEPDYLTPLLEVNPQNHMAREYLMASYMVLGNLAGLNRALARLDLADYPRVPRHWQEAALVYLFMTRRNPNVDERAISADVRKAYSVFAKLCSTRLSRPEFREHSLRQLDGTYFHYYYSVVMPRMRRGTG
jgi:hypothetical protein